MRLDTQTLAFVLGLAFLTQVIALFVQYRMVDKTYHGIGDWLLGSSLMALGVVFMPFVNVRPLLILAMISNPLMVLGQIFLYMGSVRFLGKKENRRILSLLYVAFILIYYYHMFIDNDISNRTIVINTMLAICAFLTAFTLFLNQDRAISSSAKYTGIVFFGVGVFLAVRVLFTISLPSIETYSEQAWLLQLGFMVPTVASNLWTFGYILMVNQRLNSENRLEKEKMKLVFNTSPDAAMITRVSDGSFVDVNVGFTHLFGLSREEVIETSLEKMKLWYKDEERKHFFELLDQNDRCENLEFIFLRKDGSQFYAMISARKILIQDLPHIVSSIRDITERKLAERHIQELVQQLEIEKNTAELNSITDSLTGLANRRYFDVALKTEFYRLKRSGATLSLIMLDVDYFKKFNDNYGHLAGDDCLMQIGSMLKDIVARAPDIVARYGGEEFVIILPETETQGAQEVAEKIRKSVEALKIPHVVSDIADYVTVSLGVVSINTTSLISPKQLVELADEALYYAKNNGRNQIAVVK